MLTNRIGVGCDVQSKMVQSEYCLQSEVENSGNVINTAKIESHYRTDAVWEIVRDFTYLASIMTSVYMRGDVAE